MGTKRATNVSLDETLVTEAKELGLSLSQAAEAGIAAAVKIAKAEAWKKDNAKALSSSNDYVEKNGLPLASKRLF